MFVQLDQEAACQGSGLSSYILACFFVMLFILGVKESYSSIMAPSTCCGENFLRQLASMAIGICTC